VEQQNIYCLNLSNVSVSLEFLPYLRANTGDWEVERVHRLDLGCCSYPLPVGFEDSAPGIRPIDRGARPLRQVCWIDHVVLLLATLHWVNGGMFEQ